MKTTEEAEVSRLRERTAVDGFVKRRGEDEGEVEGGEEEREGVGHWKRRWAKGGEGEGRVELEEDELGSRYACEV